jgi:hypothetical protein
MMMEMVKDSPWSERERGNFSADSSYGAREQERHHKSGHVQEVG